MTPNTHNEGRPHMGRYNKFLVALASALGVLATALADDGVTPSEWVGVALAFLGALGVYALRNVPPPAEPDPAG